LAETAAVFSGLFCYPRNVWLLLLPRTTSTCGVVSPPRDGRELDIDVAVSLSPGRLDLEHGAGRQEAALESASG